MKCIRAKNVQALEILAPLIPENPDMNREVFLRNLYVGLSTDNPSLYIAMLFDEVKPECIGYVIAEASATLPYVWVHLTWVNNQKAGRQGSDLLFSWLKEWTLSINRYEIRSQTRREADVLRRRGFEIIATIIGYKINDVAQDVLFNVGENDGRQQQSDDPRRTDGGTTASGQRSGTDLAGSASEGNASAAQERSGLATGDQVSDSSGSAVDASSGSGSGRDSHRISENSFGSASTGSGIRWESRGSESGGGSRGNTDRSSSVSEQSFGFSRDNQRSVSGPSSGELSTSDSVDLATSSRSDGTTGSAQPERSDQSANAGREELGRNDQSVGGDGTVVGGSNASLGWSADSIQPPPGPISIEP